MYMERAVGNIVKMEGSFQDVLHTRETVKLGSPYQLKAFQLRHFSNRPFQLHVGLEQYFNRLYTDFYRLKLSFKPLSKLS